MYELTYLENGTISMSENLTNRLNYTVESTRIEVRVRAYTSVGPGPIVTATITLSPRELALLYIQRTAGWLRKRKVCVTL